jgi:hypothetical protein
MSKSLLDERPEVERVIARGDLGDHAAVLAVKLDLRCDLRGEDARGLAGLAGEDGDRGFITGRFEGEDEHGGERQRFKL